MEKMGENRKKKKMKKKKGKEGTNFHHAPAGYPTQTGKNNALMAMSMSSGTLEAALAFGDSGEDEKIFPYFQEMYM